MSRLLSAVFNISKGWMESKDFPYNSWFPSTISFIFNILLWCSTLAMIDKLVLIHYYRHILPYFTLLYSTSQIMYVLQIEKLWQSCDKQVYQQHFGNSICSLHVWVSHFGNSHSNPNFFVIIFYNNLWFMVFDVALVIVLGANRRSQLRQGT